MLGNNLVQFNVYTEYSTEDIFTSTANIQTHNQSEQSGESQDISNDKTGECYLEDCVLGHILPFSLLQ